MEPDTTQAKKWKVGDRVCFAHQQLGQAFRVTRVHDRKGGDAPFIEIQGMPGLYAPHIFVACPAEPISLPAPEVTPRSQDSSRGLHPEKTIAGADRPGHASPTDPGAGSTDGNSDRSAPESPAPAETSTVAQLLPVLTTIAAELTKIRIELSVRNGLAAGGGYPE